MRSSIGLPRSIRVVVARYGEEIVGGAERLSRELACRLAASGSEVSVWTSCAIEEETWANAVPPGTTADGAVRVRRFLSVRRRHPRLFRQASRAFFRLPPRLRWETPWIVAQGPHLPDLVAALRDEPAPEVTLFVGYLFYPTLVGLPATPGLRILVPTAHDELPLRLRAVRRVVAAADGLWYATPEERALLEEVHPVARHRPAAVGNLGIDLPEAPDPDRGRARLGLGTPYLLYGGRRTRGKGVDELLAGHARLRALGHDVALVLTGEAGDEHPVAPGVVTVGRLDRQTWWDVLAGAVAIVVPSSLESLSLLAIEAWAVGRPVVANAASPVLAGQIHRSGGGIAYRGVGGLCEAVACLLADPGGARTMGERGREFVLREYQWEAVLERFAGVVAEASRRRRHPAELRPIPEPR